MEVLMEKAGGPEKARELINAVESRTGNTALHFAAENGHCAMVAFLLKQGAGTGLYYLLLFIYLYLLSLFGAYVDVCVVCALPTEKNALNGSKQTALHLATLAGCVPAVRMLVEHGAQILFTAAEAKSKKVSHFAVVNLTHHTRPLTCAVFGWVLCSAGASLAAAPGGL
jgi:ankyrin repeat protein